ncbi:MAG: hypothetical protein AAF485_19590, partial [Chloroflexota bacterium]
LGEFAEAQTIIETIFSKFKLDQPISFAAPLGGIAKLQLFLAQQAYDQVLAKTDEFLDIAYTLKIRPYLPEILEFKGRALLGLGEYAQAQTTLNQACLEAEDLGHYRTRWSIFLTLSQTEAKLDNLTAASHFQNEARNAVQYIVDRINRPDLESSFLNLPRVQMVLAEDVSV